MINSLYSSSELRNLSFRRTLPWRGQVLDPGSELVTRWYRILMVTSLVALFLDPLYFYLPRIKAQSCITVDIRLGILVTFFRTVMDLFFFMHIVLKFRIAFVSPSSRVFGRGELVMDRRAIAIRYLKSTFIIDFAAALPLPQIVNWFVIPAAKDKTAASANHTLALMVLMQYVPRFLVMFPLNRRLIKTTGIIARTAWSGAAHNLLLYMLSGHIVGASWYVLAFRRQHECWSFMCGRERNLTHSPSCKPYFFDCSSVDNPERQLWLRTTRVIRNCDARYDDFTFGMFADAFINEVASAGFLDKFFYCLWWGLKSLCAYGQNIKASTESSESILSMIVCIAGLVIFSHLIGQMQNYLQSTSARLEEWRVKRRDAEEWMRHRQLPEELQERVRRFVHYKWLATRGVDEEAILRSLPLDLRRQIQNHLCLALVRRVPFFARMDSQLLDAICERLVPSLNTKNAFIIREDDPVSEMLFIIRGKLESSTTNGGRTGFYNSITLGAGDFCGEELLTWALVPNSNLNLPLSTRTVQSLSEVEAFALRAEDLKIVSSQFKRLHSKKLQHAFRYYSHHWRTWGACFLQVAWRRYKKKKLAKELEMQESFYYAQIHGDELDGEGRGDGSVEDGDSSGTEPLLGATVLASKFASSTRKQGGTITRVGKLDLDDDNLKMPKMFKPTDPNFDHED